MAIKRDFEKGEVEAARSVMFELMQILNPYLKHIVLIGGSVPWVMFPAAEVPHVGTTDVDLAIDRDTVQSPDLAMINTILIQNDYKQSNDKPYIFHRFIEKGGKKFKIQVDLLTGGNPRDGDESAQAVHGCELAFEEPVETETNGILPDGHQGIVTLRIASIVSFISMKAISFMDRREPKDAYDIYYCVKYYQPGSRMLSRQFIKHMGNPLVQEGIEKLRADFSDMDARGPEAVADFLGEYHDEEKRNRNIRDAYERVFGLLQQIPLS
jgi:hypothetical protein